MWEPTEIRRERWLYGNRRKTTGNGGLERLELILEKVYDGLAKVKGGVASLTDGVGTHGIGHLIEDLVVLNEFVDKHLAVLIVHVIIARTMYEQ